jgi:hypothetical protein
MGRPLFYKLAASFTADRTSLLVPNTSPPAMVVLQDSVQMLGESIFVVVILRRHAAVHPTLLQRGDVSPGAILAAQCE